MKELSIEEKAKRYDEAIEKGKQIQNTPYTAHWDTMKEIIEHLLPELAESEDEKIKQKLIEYHKAQAFFDGNPNNNHVKFVSWLEKQGKNNMGISEATKKKLEDNLNKALEKETPKSCNEFLDEQGEQKPIKEHNACEFCEDRYGCVNPCSMKLIEEEKYTDNVEPKFHEDDWIVNEGHSYLIADIDYEQRRYLFEIGGYTHEQLNWEYIANADNKYHLWTIQDAKDGDILLSPSTPEGDKECPFIFKEIDKDGIVRFYAALLQNERLKIADGITNVIGYANAGYHIPATKEQRDLLFQKMKESGYEWDAEKKELKKIKQPKLTEFEDAIKDMMDDYRDAIDDNAATVEEVKEKAAYLLSLIPCKPDWSEEDTQYINDTLALLSFGCSTHSVGEVQEWLQSLNNRVQPKQEWSEEDESHIRYLIECLEHCKKGVSLTMTTPTAQEYIDWLKFLRPQSTWKPSEEQMKALEHYMHTLICNKYKEILFGLYTDLKTLREK